MFLEFKTFQFCLNFMVMTMFIDKICLNTMFFGCKMFRFFSGNPWNTKGRTCRYKLGSFHLDPRSNIEKMSSIADTRGRMGPPGALSVPRLG